jgi:hypothetical protein
MIFFSCVLARTWALFSLSHTSLKVKQHTILLH